MEKLVSFHGIPVEPKLLGQTRGITDGVTIDPLNDRYFVHGIGWQHFDKPGQIASFLDRPYLKYLKKTSVAAIEQKNQAKFQASLPKILRGAKVENLSEKILLTEENELRSRAISRSQDGRFISTKEKADPDAGDWDDANDYERGVHAESMPVGLDGKPLITEEDLENAIDKINIDCTINLDTIKEENRRNAADFVNAWKSRSIGRQRNLKTLLYVTESIDDNSIGNDKLVIIDANGRHSLPVGALLSSLVKVGSTLKEPEEERRPYLPKPTNQKGAKLLLQTLNTLTLDGYAPLFESLRVIVKSVGDVGKVEADRQIPQFSKAAKAFLDGAVWKPEQKVGKPEVLEKKTVAPGKPVEFKPVSGTDISVQRHLELPAKTHLPFDEEFTQIMAIGDDLTRRVHLNLFLLNKHIGLHRENGSFILTCTGEQTELIKPLQKECANILGLPTWIKVINKAQKTPPVAYPTLQKELQPA